MSRKVEIVTPENVGVVYELAGLGSRGIASMIDHFFITVVAVLLLFIEALVGSSMSKSWLIGLIIFTAFCIQWVYFIGFEMAWSGQTLGKRQLGIRVIREGGFPVDFRAVLVRNILRAVDFLPAFYGLGITAMLLHGNNKRLGDMAAGTMVVREREEAPEKSAYVAPFPAPFAETVDLSHTALDGLTGSEVSIARRFLERRSQLDYQHQQDLARSISHPLLQRLGLSDAGMEGRYAEFLDSLVKEYERRNRLS